MSTTTKNPPPFLSISSGPDGKAKLSFNLHRFQRRVMGSRKRIILALAGTQSGKTECEPPWLFGEIQRRGPGDYLAVSPSYPLMQKKLLPCFQRVFETILKVAEYRAADRILRFTPLGEELVFGSPQDTPTQIFFGHADDPESLESATAKAAVLDEAGQKRFKAGSWEAVQRRLAIHQGRVLIGTTPYNLGWLKQQIYDPWVLANRNHPEIDVINFPSVANPAFPKEEDERARRDLPPWKYRMFFRGLFERPAGLIYDCFDRKLHVCPRHSIPDSWPRLLGLDFGGVNTAGVFLAVDPDSPPDLMRMVAYREYRAGGRTAKQHAEALAAGEPGIRYCVGGSKSEGQWRDEFRAAGLAVREPPIADVEVGINRVYALIANGQIQFMDHLTRTLDMLGSYSRVLDDRGEPTEKIEDKDTFHELDALRYLAAWLQQSSGPAKPKPKPVVYRP